jgi:hypothetical protein
VAIPHRRLGRELEDNQRVSGGIVLKLCAPPPMQWNIDVNSGGNCSSVAAGWWAPDRAPILDAFPGRNDFMIAN